MSELSGETERLEKRLEALEQRVHALEHPLEARWPLPSPELEAAPAQQAAATTPLTPAGSMFSVLGRAMLGVAGAYVLRALEEVSSLPRLAVAAAGIAYAFAWLVWAARMRGGQRFAGAIYAGTSALILAPMVWELTLRFKVFSPAIAAGVVCAYALAAMGLARKREMALVPRVGCIAAAGLALALAIASHTLMPFVVVLLVLAAICEFAPGLDRVPEVRALVALAADAAIWILIYVYFASQPAGEEYPSLSRIALLEPGVAVFAVYAASVGLKTILRERPIAVFEALQTTIAFLLAAVGVADFGPRGSTTTLGMVCLVLSGAVYAAVFTIFERAKGQRNTAVFAAWGAALLLAGSYLCLPPLAAIVLLGAAAIAATIAGSRTHQVAFEFYGMVFLLAGALASGLPSFLVSALVGTPQGAPPAGVWPIACAAVLCYAAAQPREGESWLPQTLHLGFAALAACAVAALLIQGFIGLTAMMVRPETHHLALIRTLTLCVAALALVYSGAHWRRMELTRLGYAALALVAVKLVTEDLRHGHLAFIAASIFLVAFTLIAAPRVGRTRQKTPGK
jgi:hypothetical protein